MKTCGICTNSYEDEFVNDGVCDFCNPENQITEKPQKFFKLPKSISSEEYSTKAVYYVTQFNKINIFCSVIVFIFGLLAYWFDSTVKSLFAPTGLGYSAWFGLVILWISLLLWGLCRIYIQISQDIRKIRNLMELKEP